MAILTLGGIFAYLKYGLEYLGPEVPTIVHFAVLSALFVVALTCIGCSFHLRLAGHSPTFKLKKSMKSHVKELRQIVAQSHTKLKEYEPTLLMHVSTMPRIGIESFSTAKRITEALERRLSEVSKLLNTGRKRDAMQAHELLQLPLTLSGDSMTTLLDAEPLPNLKFSEYEPTLSRLFNTIQHEVDRVKSKTYFRANEQSNSSATARFAEKVNSKHLINT